MLNSIVSSAEQYFTAESWYEDRGVPYRTGWLFEGPPGNGKTSTIMVLAGLCKRPIYYLDLASIINDETLSSAIRSVPSNAILVIEDVDRLSVATTGGQGSGLTLSGLLNAIDGLIASEGRLLIMTTNHAEQLDPALIRSGRVDKRWHFPNLTKDLAQAMASQFYPDESTAFLNRCVESYDGPDLGASVWQEVFMDCRDTPSLIIDKLVGIRAKQVVPKSNGTNGTVHRITDVVLRAET